MGRRFRSRLAITALRAGSYGSNIDYVAIAMARQMLNARSDLVRARRVELCA